MKAKRLRFICTERLRILEIDLIDRSKALCWTVCQKHEYDYQLHSVAILKSVRPIQDSTKLSQYRRSLFGYAISLTSVNVIII